MKVSLKIVFVLICAGSPGFAQTNTTSPPETPPIANQATPPAPARDVSPQVAPQGPPASEQAPPLSVLREAPQPAAPGESPATTANRAETQNPYIIGPLDVLVVKVWNNPNLSGPVDVQPDGMLSMPLIGEVKADGLTSRQLKETLTERLTAFLNSPEVDVQV